DRAVPGLQRHVRADLRDRTQARADHCGRGASRHHGRDRRRPLSAERAAERVSMDLDDLDTPSLVIDLDTLERNIGEMAAVAREAGVRLRPHTKTHKSPEIARMQVDAGATGITVAKLGEAEVMADAGLDDLLIAYPLVGERKLGRLRELLERAQVRLSLDDVEVAEGVG